MPSIITLQLTPSAPAALHNDPRVKRWLREAGEKISAQLMEDLITYGCIPTRVDNDAS